MKNKIKQIKWDADSLTDLIKKKAPCQIFYRNGLYIQSDFYEIDKNANVITPISASLESLVALLAAILVKDNYLELVIKKEIIKLQKDSTFGKKIIKVKRVPTTEILAFEVVVLSKVDLIRCQIIPINDKSNLIGINNEMLDFDDRFSKYF